MRIVVIVLILLLVVTILVIALKKENDPTLKQDPNLTQMDDSPKKKIKK